MCIGQHGTFSQHSEETDNVQLEIAKVCVEKGIVCPYAAHEVVDYGCEVARTIVRGIEVGHGRLEDYMYSVDGGYI